MTDKTAPAAEKSANSTIFATYRHQHRLSRPQMALLLGLNIQTYRNYERGDRPAPGPAVRVIEMLQTLDVLAPSLAQHWRQEAVTWARNEKENGTL